MNTYLYIGLSVATAGFFIAIKPPAAPQQQALPQQQTVSTSIQFTRPTPAPTQPPLTTLDRDRAVAAGMVAGRAPIPFIGEKCDVPATPTYLGVFLTQSQQIYLCSPRIANMATEAGVSVAAARRFVVAHEVAHYLGEDSEPGADRKAIAYLLTKGDREAIEFRASVYTNDPRYGAGQRYAEDALKNISSTP